MTRQERRQRIIQACIAHQQHIAGVARQEMDSAQQQSNDYGANVDRYDSYRTKMMRARDMYAKQLSNANASLRYLQEALRLPPFERAEHGSIVITDKQRFFLSIGAGKFVVQEAESPTGMQYYFAISAQTPVYLALKGRGVGEQFVAGGITHTIVEIL
ncbi:MAG: hypothetical protein IJM88_03360 [Bacteroidales bacterium]|nr:hypothetical protein [Bacteroidales bacterium]